MIYASERAVLPHASFAVLQEAGIPIKLAATIGIAVDHRRHNRSLEGLQVLVCFAPHPYPSLH